jgi:hypothetical protein
MGLATQGFGGSEGCSTAGGGDGNGGDGGGAIEGGI